MSDNSQTATAIFAVIFLIVGFAVAGLLYTFVSVISGQTFEIVEEDIAAIRSYTDTNHSFVADNTTWVDLGNTTLRHLVIYNTTGWTVNTSDFTVNTTTGLVKLSSDFAVLNGTTMQAVYQYDDGTIRSAIQGGILSNFEAQQQIADYMPIIVLAIIITIVIGLIIGGIASKFLGPGGFYSYSYGDQGLL